MITFKHKGDFRKIEAFFKKVGETDYVEGFEKIGEFGVEALEKATPKDTGTTSKSWYYKIEKKKNGFVLTWLNSNVVDGVNVAAIIQYGHATSNGYYVEGVDYINPALKPIIDTLVNKSWKEVTRDAKH